MRTCDEERDAYDGDGCETMTDREIENKGMLRQPQINWDKSERMDNNNNVEGNGLEYIGTLSLREDSILDSN
jgi:hypothetical protein